MNADKVERMMALFAEAADCPPDQQAAFLARACPDDADLRQEVAALLLCEGETGGFLEEPAFGHGLKVLQRAAASELQAGDTVGECRVMSLLGVGGMGEVYLAEDTVHHRPVALKLIGQSRSEEVRGRHFRHERKVLATLNHPHIARLYGSGVTAKGQAYLIMEYVEGERLDCYCQKRGLDVSARLALFRKVCAAVSYAHQNLVVHRDLKPANIRVTPEGEPKLLDFGIAKLLDPEGTLLRLDPTVTMQGAMTPEYASPEQIKGEAITTASDMYSLGVVLFELLTGQRPYAHLRSRRPDELARAICEEESPRPSTVAGQTALAMAATVPPNAQTPTTTRHRSATLRRQLEGDLDNIVAKALRKEPVRRYPSVLAFSEDLRRHCEGLPVTARKDTLRYRAGKFIRRNKAGVAAAALVVLALVTGLIVAIWQAHIADQQRDYARVAQARAETERSQAELARKQAERLNTFLQTLLGSANPETGPGRELKVVQVLDTASAQLDRELAGEPALLAQAHLTLGQAYTGLKETEPALRHLRAALALDQQVYGDQHIATARAKAALGHALLWLERQRDAAEPLLREALAAERRQSPSETQGVLTVLADLGTILSTNGKMQEAVPLADESLSLARRTTGEHSKAFADALFQTAVLRTNLHDWPRSEAAFRQAGAIYRELSPQSPEVAGMLTSTAFTLIHEGKLDEADGTIHEALDAYRRTVGEGSRAFHFAAGQLGVLHFMRGDYAHAESELRSALQYMQPICPPDDDDLVSNILALGLTLTRAGKADQAEPYLREVLKQATANLYADRLAAPGYPDPNVDRAKVALAECLIGQRRYAEAEPLLLTGSAELEKRFGLSNQITLQDRQRLHDLYTAWNKPAEAARFAGNTTTRPSSSP